MRPVIRSLLFAAMSAAISGAAGAPANVCELPTAPDPAGILVTVIGRVLFGMHGAYFLTDGCPKQVPAPVLAFPHDRFSLDRAAPPVSFEANADAMARLRPYLRPSGGASEACAVITGQLFSLKKFRAHGYQGNGFGPNGLSRAVLVIKSVDQIGPVLEPSSQCGK
jgi:hypothetical protein